MWSPPPEQRSSKTVGSRDSLSNTRPSSVHAPWKSCSQWSYHNSHYDDDNFERLFLPGDDSIQSFRVHFSGQSWYSDPNPLTHESTAMMVRPHIVEKTSCTNTAQTSSMMKQHQQHYCFDDFEMNTDETLGHGGDGENHGTSFASSSLQDYQPIYDAAEQNDDLEQGEDSGLNDQDRWELKLLFSTIHNPDDQSRGCFFPPRISEPADGCDNPHPTSIPKQTFQRGEVIMPDCVDSTGTPGARAAPSSSSCEDGPPRGSDFCAPHRVQSPQHDDILKPVLTTSLDPVDVCSISHSSSAHHPDTKEERVHLDNVNAAQSDSPGGDACSSTSSRFRIYQEDQWMDQYKELQEFAKETGHTFVPCGYPDRDSLARWTKRQRYQYKLRLEGKVSTMTKERIALLDQLGFIWNSQVAVWEKRLSELKQFKRLTGHCNVPSHFAPNQKLATWVKASNWNDTSLAMQKHLVNYILTDPCVLFPISVLITITRPHNY